MFVSFHLIMEVIHTIRFTSYNCKNVKSSVDSSVHLCGCNDIIFLQETWLSEYELDILSSLHPDCYARGVSSMKADEGILVGRPFGGIAISWRKALASHVVVDVINDIIMTANVKCGVQVFLAINVYMPYADRSEHSENYELFMSTLGDILTCADASPTSYVVIIGEWNSNVSSPSIFGREMLNFCTEFNFIIYDVEVLGITSDAFTFHSEAHGSISWRDHCTSSVQVHNCIASIKVNYDVLSSDHFPLSVSVKVDGIRAEHVGTNNVHLSLCNWSKAEDVALTRYKDCCESTLSCVHIPVGAVTCCDPMCTDAQHIGAIDNMYSHVINCMKNASTSNIRQCGISNAHGSCIPGWNDYVKDSHDEARACFLLWVTHGKPKHGDIFMNMKNSRARFKYALRMCQRNEVQLRADTLASHLMHTNYATFWKDVGRNSCTNTPLPNTVNGETGSEAITEMWRTYYKNLFSSIKSNRHKDEIVGKIANYGVDCD